MRKIVIAAKEQAGETTGAPPLFIVGAPRSGTTVLRSMLAANPDLSIPPESHFIPRLFRRYQGSLRSWTPELSRRLAEDVAIDAHFRTWGLDPTATVDHVLATRPTSFATTIERFFSTYAAHEGRTRWGDKTPSYAFFLRELRALFPNLRVLHLIRDGRDVACSHLSLARRGAGWTARTSPTAAAWWKASIRAARREGKRLADRYLEVRYEDLVSRPEATLAELCVFAELDFDERMLHYERVVNIPAESPYRNAFERVREGLQTAARDWRSELTPAEIAGFEAVADTELAELGYELSGTEAGALERARARARGSFFMAKRRLSISARLAGHRYAAPLARSRARRRSRQTPQSNGG